MEDDDDDVWVDHYEVLGLSAQAESGDLPARSVVARAFRKLALRLHPDKQKAGASAASRELAAERFAKVSRSSEVLQDDTRRAKFDARYRQLREEKIRQAQLDIKSRTMEVELEEREALSRRAKAQQRKAEATGMQTAVWIQEQDKAYKRKMLAKFSKREGGAVGAGGSAGGSATVDKDTAFFQDIFLNHEAAVLDALNKQATAAAAT